MISTGVLFTDRYELTMAQLYFRRGLANRRSRFEYSFRAYPDYGTHQAGYAITAGLGPLLEWMNSVRFDDEAIGALALQQTATGGRMFGDDFLAWLKDLGGFGNVSMWAVPEGRVVHPNTPITVVEAPLPVAQLLESSLLNHLNYTSLIATKASRVVEAAHGGTVLEFGLRRAPGLAANAATRAALIGGVDFSSNEGASHVLGLPAKGTHAHSMVQVFLAIGQGELEAFRAYAEVYPDDCLLLVDTVDTIEFGVPNAILVFDELRSKGHEPVGIRLDSGDLAHLAVRSAALLDEAGYPDVSIVLSSQLDELTIWQIRNQITEEAPRYGVEPGPLLQRLTYGVGSRMVTSQGDSSFDGVYKIAAVEDESGRWAPTMKISDSPAKIANPGIKKLWRVYDQRGLATADVIALDHEALDERPLELVHPSRAGVHRRLADAEVSRTEEMLEPVQVSGSTEPGPGDIFVARERRTRDLDRLDPGVRRLVNPHEYHVSLSRPLADLKRSLIEEYTS